MDKLDIILLKLLQENSRITISELSKQLALVDQVFQNAYFVYKKKVLLKNLVQGCH